MKYKYSNKKSAQNRREAIIEQIPYDKYVKPRDIVFADRKSLDKELEALVKSGYVRKVVEYSSATGAKTFRRVVC